MSTITVSDHAVVRFCERVLGFDMDDVRKRILANCKGTDIAHAVHADGFVYHIRNATYGEGRVVTTVRPAKFVNARRVPRDKPEHVEAAE